VDLCDTRGACQTAFEHATKIRTKWAHSLAFEAAADQTAKYASMLARELERIRLQCDTGSGQSWWSECTALVVPGCPQGLAGELLEATRAAAASAGLVDVVAALPTAPSVLRRNALYFGSVENMAGLERPFVIVTGMQHPTYTIYRQSSEGWADKYNRVDPRVYLGVTRCTVELTVAEVQCAQFAVHYGISAASARASGGIAPLIGEAWHSAEAARVFVEASVGASGRSAGINHLRLGVTVDLASPPPPEELATAVSLRMVKVSDALWSSGSFRWDQCVNGVHELNMFKSFGSERKDGDVLTRIGLWGLGQHLEVLWLDGNGFTSLPARIGKLEKLTQLNLSQNQLASVPAELGQLTSLTQLSLRQNQLASVPAELGQLTSLTLLNLSQNQLASVPAELGQLTSLTTLSLSQNQLASVPAELGQLTSLTQLSLSQNQLASVPAELGKLTSLTQLFLFQNQLASVPAELGKLTSLTHFNLCSNNITTLPPSFGNLVRLQEFAVDDHVADDPDSATAVRRLGDHSVEVKRNPSGRTPQKIRLLKKLSARRATPSPAPTTSPTVANNGAGNKSVDELLAELGELPEGSGSAGQSHARASDKSKKGKKGKKGKR
jgi:hypothetical protein